MSEVTKDLSILDSIDEILPSYEGSGNDMRTGLEMELSFFNAGDPDMATMTVPQNKVVKNAALETLPGDWVRNEPTAETLEVNTIAEKFSGLQKILDDANTKQAITMEKAAGIGLKRSYFQQLPEKTSAQLLANLMDIERYQAFFGPPRADMVDIAAYFSVCKSNQVSVSYRDPDHMLANIRRLYFLAPFLYVITDNTSGFNEGKKFTGSTAMHHRLSLKDRGGVPDYLFTAETGRDYILAHINHAMNNPLYVYYDADGVLQRLPSGVWSSFNKLKADGLNMSANYWLGETVLWPDVKIAALKDAEGNVINHRYEARTLGVGVHQHQSAQLIVAALAFLPEFAEKADRLLDQFGFSMSDLEASKKNLTLSYTAAREHDNHFMDIAYGSGHMLEFGRAFADLLESAYIGRGFDVALTPILSICRSGCTDSKVNRLLFSDMEETLNHQRHYDPAIFANPNQNAKMIYQKEIQRHNAGACSQTVI